MLVKSRRIAAMGLVLALGSSSAHSQDKLSVPYSQAEHRKRLSGPHKKIEDCLDFLKIAIRESPLVIKTPFCTEIPFLTEDHSIPLPVETASTLAPNLINASQRVV